MVGVAIPSTEKYSDSGGHYDLKTDFEGLLEVDPDVLVFAEAVNALGGQNVYGNTVVYEQTLDVLRTNEQEIKKALLMLYAEQAQYHGVHAVDTRRPLGENPHSTAL